MHTRNETLLQMYGEMSERAEELRLDLMDVKEMYKQQVRVCVTIDTCVFGVTGLCNI